MAAVCRGSVQEITTSGKGFQQTTGNFQQKEPERSKEKGSLSKYRWICIFFDNVKRENVYMEHLGSLTLHVSLLRQGRRLELRTSEAPETMNLHHLFLNNQDRGIV